LARPLSDRELEAKFRDLAAYGAPGLEVGRVIAALWTIDQTNSAGDVMKMALPPT
jgi:hypothetical protein